MPEIIESLDKHIIDKLEKKKQPEWISPMMAKLTHNIFSDKNWIYERKLDGIRCIVVRKGEDVKLYSRNHKNLNNTYPELVEAFRKQKVKNLICDGEIVTFDGRVTSFSKLQGRMQIKDPEEAVNTGIKVFFYTLDLMYLDRYDLTNVPLKERKSILKKAIDFKDPVRFTAHRNENGQQYYKEACEKGWEGLIAKKADSAYVHSRSGNWLKFKCINQQEFVIGGYTEPQGQREGFGALLVGYYEDSILKYAGKVGTGYNDQLLKDLSDKMNRIERKSNPFDSDDINSRGVHWVEPNLIGEIGFTEWTNDGKLRHPRFLGLRHDKKPKEVVKES